MWSNKCHYSDKTLQLYHDFKQTTFCVIHFTSIYHYKIFFSKIKLTIQIANHIKIYIAISRTKIIISLKHIDHFKDIQIYSSIARPKWESDSIAISIILILYTFGSIKYYTPTYRKMSSSFNDGIFPVWSPNLTLWYNCTNGWISWKIIKATIVFLYQWSIKWDFKLTALKEVVYAFMKRDV